MQVITRPCACGQVAKYCCPRCNAPYCSVPCYRTHGPACSETFYKEQIEAALRTETAAAAGSADRQKMVALLQREYTARLGACVIPCYLKGRVCYFCLLI